MALAQAIESEFAKALRAQSGTSPPWRTDVLVEPADRRSKQPSLVKRVSHGLARFLIIFCIGVAATLAWQSYGNAAREMIANSSPQLGWLVPSASASPERQLEAMRQRVDQLAASQQRMAGGIAKLLADQQELLQKISAPLPQSAAAPTRKPVPLPSSEAR
jgi:hypothetical protein